jgi:hypothetical protein
MRTIAIGILIVVFAHGGAAAQTAGEQTQIVGDFQQRVADYTRQHQCLDLFPEAVNAATPAPRIFTLPVAMVFRQLIARTLAERDGVAAVSRAATTEHLAVLQPFPDSKLYDFPRVLADALPLLPEPLEYRLVGHDLVVRDRESNNVVGVLREAVGTAYTVVR